jgi:hypothetical protein
MKKILLLLPIIGIYSSLFAQAPTVNNVMAEQREGTKYIEFSAEMTGKTGDGIQNRVNVEFWYKGDIYDAGAQWVKISEIKSINFAGEAAENATELFKNEGHEIDPSTGFYKAASFQIPDITTDAPMNKIFLWDAGKESDNFSSNNAQIKIIAFYTKMDEFGSEKPAAEQVSGWDGIGEFDLGGSSGGGL